MRSMDGSNNRNHHDNNDNDTDNDFPSRGGEGEGGDGGEVGERVGGNGHPRPCSPTLEDFTTGDLPVRPGRPGQLGGGLHHHHHYHHHQQQQQQRPSRGLGERDSSADEIIRFVRGYHHHLERESTWLRLQKKAPLPGIGQANHSLQESSFPSRHNHHNHHECRNNNNSNIDGDEDDDDDEDLLLDNEVSRVIDGCRHQFGAVDDLRFIPTSTSYRKTGPGQNRHERFFKPNASYGPPASHHRHVVRPLDNHGHVGRNFSGRARKGLGRSLKQLPPIARGVELPERPSAPSPSLTPPGESEELDSAGEPVDFIDAP
ncbi:uncharacterized protein LOC143296190 [Babylonia areolata]|uniref:uncharacterized protein LOC143296190 n=1 Tax=Babylonia areolata TaxID=304850 RepID=UPI003FD1FDD0